MTRPSVAGIGLLAAFAGRVGLLSGILDPLRISVVFTTTAVVLAIWRVHDSRSQCWGRIARARFVSMRT